MERPDLDEALSIIFYRCEYAARLAGEAYRTPDGEDDEGKVDPIHPYAAQVLTEAVPLAAIGLFILAFKNQPSEATHEQ